MGIRFFCPDGHKLNVKEHLAGKAGYCPHCGTWLMIPLQSTRLSSKLGGGLIVASAALPDSQPSKESTEVELIGATIDDLDVGLDILHILEDTLDASDHHTVPDVIAASPAIPVPRSRRVKKDAAPVASDDSELDNAPAIPHPLNLEGVAWHLQIPRGSQYGPKTGREIYEWICEKRIAADMLLWREGWGDWREIGQVVPALFKR